MQRRNHHATTNHREQYRRTIPASNARRYTPGVFSCWWASPNPPDKVLAHLVERSLRSGYGKMANAHFPFPALPVPLVEKSLIAYNN